MAKSRRPAPPVDAARNRRHGELLYAVHELSRLTTTYFDRAVGRLGITHAQWWAMMHVAEHEGATQSELAAIMQMGRASTGRILERLEEKHWIERRDDSEDSRLRRVYTAPGWKTYLALTEDGAGQLYRDFLDGISPEEEDRLFDSLSRIKANAERRIRSQDPAG